MGKPSRQEFWVIVSSAVFIIAAIFITMAVTGNLSITSSGSSSADYKNVTATDALMACKNATKGTFGNNLTRQVMDDHSSRFDQATGQFKVFIKAEVGGDFNTPDTSYYISCFVSARSGGVVDFDAHEDKDVKPEAIRKDAGNLFGWPK